MKKTFKEIVKETPKPKILKPDEKLPYVFDLHWDCKCLKDLVRYGVLDSPDVRNLLAQHGYDVQAILKYRDHTPREELYE